MNVALSFSQYLQEKGDGCWKVKASQRNFNQKLVESRFLSQDVLRFAI